MIVKTPFRQGEAFVLRLIVQNRIKLRFMRVKISNILRIFALDSRIIGKYNNVILKK